MREGDRVVVVHTDWWSAFGRRMKLERGMRLTVRAVTRFNGVLMAEFDELSEDDDGDTPLFMVDGFRPAVLN